MSHTKAPWKIGYAISINNALAIFEQKAEPGINPKDFRTICLLSEHANIDKEDFENARRIVACVNACEGIPTETLESEIFNHGLLKLSSTANEFARFKSENASLKNAIQEIIGLCQDDDGSACAALDAMDNIYYIRRTATMAIEGITEQDIADTLPDEPIFK